MNCEFRSQQPAAAEGSSGAADSPESDGRAHRSQLRCCPPLSPSDDDCSRSGPGPTTNWLSPGRLLCGAMPEPVEADHRRFASITHFVDLTDQSEPEEFRAECEGRALAAGTTPPTFIRHTIREFSTGSDDAVLAAVSSVMQALVEDPAAVVYLHCRAGHGRTGMVAAIFIGLAYPTLTVSEVMGYVQSAHNEREDSWDKWESPETVEQHDYACSMIGTMREQIAPTTAGVGPAAPGGGAAAAVTRWCEPALLAEPAEGVACEEAPQSQPEPEPEPEPERR
jgi:hypothetical protein